MAHFAIDIDGTISAAPHYMQDICSALQAAAHRVTILTGVSSDTVTQRDFDEKANYLNSMGLGQSYDDMTVISNKGNLAKKKAQWCVDNGVDVMVDNNRANCQQAVEMGIPLVLCPWASRV